MPQQHLSKIGYAAQAILARRDHSEAELAKKLTAKGYAADDIAATIAKLKKIKLVNDREFARRYAGELVAGKPAGPRLLAARLRAKGIEAGITSDVLAEIYPPGREEELARQAAAAWRRLHPRHAGDKVRLFRFLTSRGFSGSAINSVTPAYSA